MASSTITEKTLLPLSVVVVLCSGIFWVAVYTSKIEANAADISEVKEFRKDDRKEIIERLNILDNKLDRLLRRDPR